jgi:UDP-N-acetylglucosamine acyltransferase
VSDLIHPTAIIEPGARLHPSVRVGAYSIIESGAALGAGCIVETCARVYGRTSMGRGNRLCHGVTLGSEPQDLGYTAERAKPLTIGDDNHFKEGVNISHGIKYDTGTRIGSRNLFMAYSHVGHDCTVGDDNIFANTATLAGHVELDHHVLVSGQVAIHQFCRVGAYVMIGGVSGVPKDVPPFVMVNGQRARILGLNLVGLKRNGFDQARRTRIKAAYQLLFRSGLRLDTALERLKQEIPGPDTAQIVAFCRASERGVTAFV